MSSRDERREVAERLRRAWPEAGDMEKVWDVLDPILGTHDGQDTYRAWEQTFNRLADLIEPQKEGMCCDASDEGNVFECSRCGCVVRLRTGQADAFENVTYGPTLTMPNGRGGELSFCPHCGARVVSGNGE